MKRWENEQNNSEMMIYTTEDGLTKIETTFDGDTVWLSIDQMAELFQRDRSVIGKHVRNIFKEGELQKAAVWAKFAHTAADGKVYDVDYYNLDVIISVGYRVKSQRGVQFRIWATGIVKEYMRKGFALDDERLKNLGGGGYFKELLERIRDIRASEKVFYRQVLEIYATSIDYDPKAEISIQFFKKVQNKIHYAIHGQTAAEVIYTRADAEKEFMGLTTFAGNQPTLKEAVVAKNYLNEKELRAMGQLAVSYTHLIGQRVKIHNHGILFNQICQQSGETAPFIYHRQSSSLSPFCVYMLPALPAEYDPARRRHPHNPDAAWRQPAFSRCFPAWLCPATAPTAPFSFSAFYFRQS